jgi:hypothetical protein
MVLGSIITKRLKVDEDVISRACVEVKTSEVRRRVADTTTGGRGESFASGWGALEAVSGVRRSASPLFSSIASRRALHGRA